MKLTTSNSSRSEHIAAQIHALEKRLPMAKTDRQKFGLEGKIKQLKIRLEEAKKFENLAR